VTPPALTVVALGGNAISPPRGSLDMEGERAAVARVAAELAVLAESGARLLIVHGNGPQVGRLLAARGLGESSALDIHVAQTQGELGYLLAEALDTRLGRDACAALVTRVLVDGGDPAFAHPDKPVGPVLAEHPIGVPSVAAPDGHGWRRVVASPRPVAIVEQAAIAALLPMRHVIAGGGGGVPLGGVGRRRAQPAVVDKDWVASLLAITFKADRLIYVTDVPHAFDRFGDVTQSAIRSMSVSEARMRLGTGVFAPGSMAPKVESAVEYVEATGRQAVIAPLGLVQAALERQTGTIIGG
jgi:carbamate kinase